MDPFDAALTQRPDRFELRRSPSKTILSLVMAGIGIALAVLVALNAEWVTDFVSRGGGGRLRLLGSFAVPAAIGIGALLTLVSLMIAWKRAHSWIVRDTGYELVRVFRGKQPITTAEAEGLHARLASGDPRNYLPLRMAERGKVGVSILIAMDHDLALVSVVTGSGAAARALPLIELSGPAYAAIARVPRQRGFTQPAGRDVVAAYLGADRG